MVLIVIEMCFRPYEVIAVATVKGIAIWHLGLNPGMDGRLSTERVALLSGHNGEVSLQKIFLSSHSPFYSFIFLENPKIVEFETSIC